jgi:hypothetical protein
VPEFIRWARTPLKIIMTSSHTKFLAQLESGGRQRADGFSLAMFEHMTAPEKAIAFDALALKFESDPGEEIVAAMWYASPEAAGGYFRKHNIDNLGPAISGRIFINLYKYENDSTWIEKAKHSLRQAALQARNDEFGYFDLLTLLVDIEDSKIVPLFRDEFAKLRDKPVNDVVDVKLRTLIG